MVQMINSLIFLVSPSLGDDPILLGFQRNWAVLPVQETPHPSCHNPNPKQQGNCFNQRSMDNPLNGPISGSGNGRRLRRIVSHIRCWHRV
jgi:hypothetical protein